MRSTQYFCEVDMSGSKTFGKGLFSGCSLLTGGLCVIIYIVMLAISGSPFEMIHKLDFNKMIPPMWMWRIFNLAWAFLGGAAAGSLICDAACRRIAGERVLCACKGGLFFLSAFFLSVVHYPVFFCLEKLFIAFLVALLATACAAVCAVIWSKASPIASIVLAGNALWLLYVAFLSACLLIGN